MLNMIETDIGRPLGDLKPNIEAPGLEDMILQVVKDLRPTHTVVHDRGGNPYDLRIKPYRTADNRIDGVVMTVMERGKPTGQEAPR